jgi:N12 class adenine-specific DNA methylase
VGFTFDKKNKTVQTKRATIFFELIHSISNVLKEIKNGDPVVKNQISARVTLKIDKSNFTKDFNTLNNFTIYSEKHTEK